MTGTGIVGTIKKNQRATLSVTIVGVNMSKTLAVGDIHTKTWIIDEVEKLVDDYDFIVFCGDYADNWNTGPTHSLAAWRMLRMLMMAHPEKVHAVIGNHDYAYIHPEIAGRSSGWNGITYQLINSPENRKLKEWLLSLPPTLQIEGVTYSHAGVTEEWDDDTSVQGLWNDTSPIWARPFAFGGNIIYREGPQVFGHNPHQTCTELERDIWCIDTFSEHQDNSPIGDYTVLEIIDGHKFKTKRLKHDNNDNTSSIKDRIS